MSLISLNYFIFLLISLIFYFSIKKYQYIILFFSSIIFYLLISATNCYVVLLLVIIILMSVYFSGIIVDRTTGFLRTLVLLLTIVLLVSLLIYFKYFNNLLITFSTLFPFNGNINLLEIISVIGISYYVLTSISYLIDIYWGTIKSEKNIIKLGLFIFYFPCLISGPIQRYNEFKSQIDNFHNCDYDRISHGVRLMIFGYVKKVIIASRFSFPVKAIYGNYSEASGVTLIFATICYAVELYADFSGCMDIISGTSVIYGINLPENFNAPFFSHSVQEFWQRWHITLGVWFKDYVMYPIQKSTPMVFLSQSCKKVFSKKIAKRIPFYIAMIALWFFIGLWHGGSIIYFVASAIIPMSLLIIEDIIYPLINNIVKVDTENILFQTFECVRTFLSVCICWVFVCSENIKKGIMILNRIFTKFIIFPNELSITTIKDYFHFCNISKTTLMCLCVALPILFFTDYLVYKRKITIFNFTDKFHYVIRIGIIYFELLCIALLGTSTSEFIYFQF